MELKSITWPVYWLGNLELKKEGTSIYVENEYLNTETLETHISKLIIDDGSVVGDSLGKRRLKLYRTCTLFPINKTIYFLGDLIKLATSKTWFIDNQGNTFTYRKTTRAKLTCHKIKNILPAIGMGAVLEVEGIPQRFKVIYRPFNDESYVGVLTTNNSYILYGLYKEPFKNSYRKI